MPPVTDPPLAALAADLRRVQSGPVRFDAAARHLYAGDGSHHRVVPHGVVVPRTVDDLVAAVATCARHGVAVTARGAGTSLAGNAVNRAVVLDASRWLRAQVVDPQARTARVEPGVVLDDLRREANRHGLTFGPDPSTADRCTIGGMLGNNACGAHSLTTGRTADNVLSLRAVLADGATIDTSGPTPLDGPLRALGSAVADEVARRLPTIPRRVSGYNLDDLRPDRYDLARALVGSEGTLAVTTGATLRLVPWSPHRALAVLGHRDGGSAADHVPALLRDAEGMVGLEGIDHRVVAGARHRGALGTALLPAAGPDGTGTWLLAEFEGDRPEHAVDRARRCVALAAADGVPAVLVEDPVAQAALWQVRSAGLGAVTFVPGEPAKVGGWEDAAVDPSRLGDYLRGFEELAAAAGMQVATYGHFGDGCVHTKVGVDHATPRGVAAFRAFVEAAADLTVAHGGSLSGEHGDGRSRSELLERMLGPELVAAQREVKALFDPEGLLNPGIVVDPAPLDGDLRFSGTRAGALVAGVAPAGLAPERTPLPTWFRWLDDAGDVAVAANRCIGMGACRRDDDHATMCPTYRVSGEEQHSTRGRARLLQEAMRADTRAELSLDDPGVAEALDLCLSCKGCLTDCPVEVDLASLKAEFNAHRWRGRRRGGRRRPLLQTAFGRTADLLRLAARAPRTANALASSPPARVLLRRLGVAPRPLPRLAPEPFRRWWARRGGAAVADGVPVVLFADTFSDLLAPRVLADAVRVLEATGHHVVVLDSPVCCARPLVDPGMLERARDTLAATVAALAPHAARGVPIVAVEPTCASALVDEGPNLLGTADARAVAGATTTLAGLLVDLVEAGRWQPPRLAREAVVHGHCHQHATLRLDAEARLLDAMGMRWRDLDAGCCGLAGAYGFEAGEKHAMSVAIGESRLLPAVRSLDPGVLVLADGWSCRTQLEHLGAGRRPWHLASLLAHVLATRDPAAVPADEPGP